MKYNKAVVKAACALIFFSIFVGTIWDFSLQLQSALTTETYRTLSEVSSDYNKAFLDRISYQTKTLQVLAVSMQEMQGRTENDITRFLQNAVDAGGFSEIAVCDSSGRSCSSVGPAENVAHCDYFQKAMRGETGISESLRSATDGSESIVISVPIDSRQEIGGVLLGVYPLATAGEQLLDFSYYSDGYGFIISPEGTILLSSEHTDKLADERNLFSFFEKTDFTDFSVAELKSAIAKNAAGSFAFVYHGERRFVSFTPSTVNNWYTFSIASDALMLRQEKTTNQIVLRLVLKLIVLSVLLFIWIVLENKRHGEEILMANQKYQSLLSHINGGMIVAAHALTAEETIVSYVSPGFTDMTGYTLEDIQTLYQGRYLDVIWEEDRKTVFQIYLDQLQLGTTYRMPYRIRKKDGSLLWVMDNGYLVSYGGGLHNHSIVTDISAVKAQEEALRRSENRFSVAINASSGALFEVDLKQQLYTHFENAERIFGVSAEKLLEETRAFSSLPYREFVEAITVYFFHPDDYDKMAQTMAELSKNLTASCEARLRRFDNSYIWARIDLNLSLDEFGVKSRLVGFMSDIDTIKKQSELLEGKVQTDPMTGLYNKIAMATRSDKILKEYPDGRHALIVLDIDNFKGINDSQGHAFGDLVLLEICAKLNTAFRNNDLVGRMGGDEFAVLIKNVPDVSSVLKRITQLSASFRQTYTGEKSDCKLSCSIGIIVTDNNHDTFETLYRKADAALYQAKRNGRDQFVLYQEENADSYPIETIRTNDVDLQHFKPSRSMEVQIFELLYTSKDFNISIHMALAAIGQQYHVSRVTIFENNTDHFTTSNIYEWCNNGIPPKMGKLQNLPLSRQSESILDSFDSNGLLYCSDVRELPPYLREILESQGVLSTLQITIVNEENTYGFIGFDECTEHRVWTLEEIENLSFLAKVLSVFLFKKKAEISILENLHTRLKILDILPDYICVVNPETHTLVYANSKMQELLPTAKPGAFCFSTLRGGQTAPCETCLLERIKRGDTNNLEILSEDKQLRLAVNAISINWSHDKKMVLLYGAAHTQTPL